ncbi:MAG: tetratricopeptide repeat protein [Planctomycetes bacterium]|nr:tetratricopeptide repeat protein [Planctomycetota bacterium]
MHSFKLLKYLHFHAAIGLLLAAWFCAGLQAGEDADYRRAHHLYTLKEYKLAVEELNRYLQTHAQSERLADARLLLAESYYQLQQFPEAAAQFEGFLAGAPQSDRRAQAQQRAVKAHYLAKSFEKALTQAEVFLKEHPDPRAPGAHPALPQLYEHVLYYAGESAYALKRGPAAEAHWKRLETLFPESKLLPDAAEGLGWIAFERQAYDAALAQFKRTAETPEHPKAGASQLMVARSLAQLGKRPEALAALEGVAKRPGGGEQARAVAYWRASILVDAAQWKEALAALQALTAAFPDHPDTAALAAQAAYRSLQEKRYAEALALADLYLSKLKGEGRPAVARAKAQALSELKREPEARAAAQAAVKEAEAVADPARRSDEHAAALLLLAETAPEEAAGTYAALVKSYAERPQGKLARYRLSLLAGKRKDWPEARTQAEALLKALNANQPEDGELQRLALFAAADFAFWMEDYAAAEQHLTAYLARKEVQEKPQEREADLAALRLAWCRFKQKDSAGCLRQLGALPAPFATPERDAEGCYLRGLALLGQNQPEEALQAFKLLIDKHAASPYVADASHAAAERLVLEKQYAPALSWLDRLLDTPAYADAARRTDGLLMRAQARLGAGRPGEGLADAEALLKREDLGTRKALALLLKALCLAELPERNADAEAALGALLTEEFAKSAETRQARLMRARIRFAAKRFADARSDLDAFLGAEPLTPEPKDRLDAALLRALCSKELKDTEAARAQFDALLALPLQGAPAFEAAFQAANLRYDAGAQAEAVPLYHRALEAAANAPDVPAAAQAAAWLNLGWALKLGKQAKDSEAAFAQAYGAAPEGPLAPEARHQRALLLAENGQVETALKVWKELQEKHPGHALAAQAVSAQGTALAKAGRYADAAGSFEAYLKANPEGELAREAQCGLGECRLQLRAFDAAQTAFMAALGAKGLDAELDDLGERALLGLAELALIRGEAAQTKKLALRVVLDRPDSGWLDAALYLCGKASEELAEPPQAIAYYRRLIEARPQSERSATAKERLKALGADTSEKP